MKICYLPGVVIDERCHWSVVQEMRMTLEQFLRFTKDGTYYMALLSRYGKEMCARYPRLFEVETCIVDIVESGSVVYRNYLEALQDVPNRERLKECAIDLTREPL